MKLFLWNLRRNLSRKELSLWKCILVALKESIQVWGMLPSFKIYQDKIFFNIESYKDIYRLHAYKREPKTVEWIKEGEGVFYDIGAGNGVYSLLAALWNKNVYAFDCNPKIYWTLTKNIKSNGLDSKIIPLFFKLDEKMTLDNVRNFLKLPQPDKIKIDVDGNEVEVLEGAKETLKNAESVFVEIEDKNKERAFELLKDFKLVFQTQRSMGKPNMYLFKK